MGSMVNYLGFITVASHRVHHSPLVVSFATSRQLAITHNIAFWHSWITPQGTIRRPTVIVSAWTGGGSHISGVRHLSDAISTLDGTTCIGRHDSWLRNLWFNTFLFTLRMSQGRLVPVYNETISQPTSFCAPRKRFWYQQPILGPHIWHSNCTEKASPMFKMVLNQYQ